MSVTVLAGAVVVFVTGHCVVSLLLCDVARRAQIGGRKAATMIVAVNLAIPATAWVFAAWC